MKRLMSYFFAILLFEAASFLFMPSCLEASSRQVRIGLETGVLSGKIDSSSAVRVSDASGGFFSPGSGANVEFAGGEILVNGKRVSLPASFESSQGFLRWNGKPYRGSILLVPHRNGFSVVNVLDVESYLRGVLKIEVNPNWPMEALKAQAVIARTYALRQAGRHGSEGFDLCASTHCQAYRGMAAEDPRLDRAIAETRGIVVVYGSGLAQTYYFADGAGWTADVSSVWGGGTPYLTCRPEPVFYETPHSRWKASLSQETLQKIMNTLRQPVGSILEIRPLQKDAGNRVTLLEVKGTSGSATVKGHSFRMAAGSNLIRSTLFDVSPAFGSTVSNPPRKTLTEPSVPIGAQGEDPLIVLTKQGAFTSGELMDMLLHPEKKADYLKKALTKGEAKTPVILPGPVPPASPAPFNGTVPPSFEFQGKGWGHGVGLSQWGAKALAENGWKFEAILEHYFPGTTLRTIP
jgi:stage II sporulation protein D